MSGFSFDDNTAVDPVKWIWTNAGGTFNDGRGENNYGTLIQSDATDIDKFRVHTHSSNETNSIREAFIIVQLDKDPENYTALITLSQTFVKKLKYYPLFWDYTVDPATPRPLPTNVEDANGAGWMEQGGTIMFDGVGNLMTGDGYSNNTDTYYVQTSRNDATLWIPWTPVIVATGLNDDRAHFAIDTEVTSTDNEDLFLNRVRIKAKSMNLTGTDRMVKLRVQTDAQTYAEIPVIQKPAVWNLPATPPAFDADGGYEELILDAPTGMHYTVEVESLTGAENHFAYLNDPDDPYDPNAGEDSRPKYSKLLAEDATKPFIVGFPKLIYPNLYSSVAATIKVTMVESGQSKSFTIMQLPPQQKTVNILGIGSISHGGISNNANKPGYTYNPTVTSGSDNDGGDESAANGNWWGYYCGAWARNLHDPAHFGNLSTSAVKISTVVPGMANTNIANSGDVWASASAAATLVHFSRPGETTGHQAVNTTLWNWVNGTSQMAPGSEGVLHVSLEDVDEAEADRAFSYAIFGENGMEITGGQEDSVFPYKLPAVQEGRLWDYLKAGPFASEVTQTVLGYTWYMEGNSSFMNTSSVTDAGAIPILVGTSLNHNRSTVPVGTAEGWCGLFIDPVRRIVVRADSEFVRNQVEMNGIVNNVQAWMIETAQWGTHFSEYFWESPRYTMPEPQPQPQP
jgi:hypothetical protein